MTDRDAAARLRRAAEKSLSERSPVASGPAGDGDVRRLVHELQVHQIELEMQNAELEQHRQRLESLVRQRTLALESSNRRLSDTQLAMDRVGIGIRWANADTGRFLYVNPAGAKMLGYTVDEMLALGVLDVEPGSRPESPRAVERAPGERLGTRIETTNRTRDGRFVPVEITRYDLPADADLPARSVAFVTDIGERKRWEASLIEARHAAEAASRAKSRFLANMSHELRTPLNAIVGASYLLRHEGNDVRDARRLDMIDQAGRRLGDLIGAILALSKLDSGETLPGTDPVDPERIAREALASVAQRAAGKSLRLALDAGAPAPPLLGDPELLSRALLCYLTNAIEFTEAGSVTVVSRWEAESDDGVRVRYEVVDTGPGIASEDAARLFSDFEQVDDSSTRAHGGAGLGLSTTRRLARLMGGDAGVTSTPGRGSTFWFTARLVRARQRSAHTDPGGDQGPRNA